MPPNSSASPPNETTFDSPQTAAVIKTIKVCQESGFPNIMEPEVGRTIYRSFRSTAIGLLMLAKIFDVLVDELEDYSIPNTTPTVKPKIKEINGFGKKVGERANIDLNDAKTSFFLIMNAMLLPGSWLQLILSRDKKEPCLLFFYFLDEQYFDALDPVSVRKITERFTSWRWQPDHHLGQATQIWQALLDEHCKASKLTFSSAEK